MNLYIKILFLSITLAAVSASYATPAFPCCPTDERSASRPDAHAPISVMGDHTHSKGGWMLSYRHMSMEMDNLRRGSARVSSEEFFLADGGYTVSPEWMSMNMHMLGIMYAPTERLTLMAMGNYLETEMTHEIVSQMTAMMINGGDTKFTTHSRGLGDLEISALYRFYLKENRKAHFGLGLNLPTGSIDKKDRLPSMGGATKQQMPASMQLGAGTFDLLPSLTFVQQFEDWSWGAQANGVLRLENKNSNNYRNGHKIELLGWAGYNLAQWLGLNGGLSYNYAGALKGVQTGVNRMGPNGRSVSTAFGENYGGHRLDLILGINFIKPSGFLENHRLSFDLRLPIWRDLNGYQLETNSVLTFGWQRAF